MKRKHDKNMLAGLIFFCLLFIGIILYVLFVDRSELNLECKIASIAGSITVGAVMIKNYFKL